MQPWPAVSYKGSESLWGPTWPWTAAWEELPPVACCSGCNASSWSPVHALHWYCHGTGKSTHTHMVQWPPEENDCRTQRWHSGASSHRLSKQTKVWNGMISTEKANDIFIHWLCWAMAFLCFLLENRWSVCLFPTPRDLTCIPLFSEDKLGIPNVHLFVLLILYN